MAELFIFSKDDELLTILSEETGLVSTWFKDYENQIVEDTFVFEVQVHKKYQQGYDSEYNLTQVAGSFVGTVEKVNTVKEVSPIEFIEEENQVVFRDRDGDLRLVRIKELYEVTTNGESRIRAVCEPGFCELYDHFIEDRRIINGTAQTALDRALQGSRYVGEVTVNLGLATTNFYWINAIEAIWNIIETWGGSVKDTVTLDENNNIIERKIWIVQRLGADNGLIVDPDYNAEHIERKTLSYPVTALYAQGASLEIVDEEGEHTGGYTRYITFEDVEWSVAKGDPVDKPKGQKWVGDPELLEKYGYLHNGVRKHRFGHFSDQSYEDPEELLKATWEELQKRKEKEIIYEAQINVQDRHVSLGDTVTIIDRQHVKPIELQSQITGLEYDILDMDNVIIVVGKYIDINENPLQKEIDQLKREVKRPTRITENNFPDIKPATPTNVQAIGSFKTIQLYWDYDSSVYISHYEVYGSQNPDFVPDSQYLLYRGRVSAFAHKVDTDETWYYYVRAVNVKGTPSDFSNRVSASSVRIMTPDILFGSITSELLANNLELANKLSQNTLDWINSGPMEALEAKVDIDKVISAINISAETIRILGHRIMITGDTFIQSGVIGTAAIANAAIDRFHLKQGIIENVHIADATIEGTKIKQAAIDTAHIADLAVTDAKIASLNVNKLVGNVAYFTQYNWNNISQQVKITGTGLETYSGMQRTSLLNGSGHQFYKNDRLIGIIGTAGLYQYPNLRGLNFQLGTDAYYMAWSHLENEDDPYYTIKFAWYKNDQAYDTKGFNFSDHVTIKSSYNLYVRTLSTTNYSSGNRHVQLQNFLWDGKEGVMFRRGSSGAGIFLHDAETVLYAPPNAAYLGVGNDGQNRVYSLDIYNRTYTNAPNVYVTSYGTLGRSTSSRKYKLFEEPISIEYARKLYDVEVKTWFDKRAIENYERAVFEGEETEALPVRRIPGLIAEDVHDAGLEMFVDYNEEGEPEAISSNLWVLLIPLVKELREKINQLERRFYDEG